MRANLGMAHLEVPDMTCSARYKDDWWDGNSLVVCLHAGSDCVCVCVCVCVPGRGQGGLEDMFGVARSCPRQCPVEVPESVP